MITEKLYDMDSHLSDFEATVLKCERNGGNYAIVLDRTAFFPEGGGQRADTGVIGRAAVTDVRINGGEIVHYADSPVEIGSVCLCSVDRELRFRRMQNHSGEHLVSGIVHNIYGFDNVGFHMGDDVTVDFSGELTDEDVAKVERLANEAVYKNVKITAEYPDEETLKNLDYRSKLELTENVRIVTIEGYDRCACCAPHVSCTGEIGFIKIIEHSRHRGGTRIRMLSGLDAYNDSVIKYDNLRKIAVRLCAKQNEAAQVFEGLFNENARLRQELARAKKEIVRLKNDSLSGDKNVPVFENELSVPELRELALDSAKTREGCCAFFSGGDGRGYTFAVASRTVPLGEVIKRMRSELNARGGGSDELIQGSANTTEAAIRDFFSEVKE